jgi:retron-type reverse transcriptase
MIFTYGQLYNAWKDTVPQNSDKNNHVKLRYELEPRLTRLLAQLEEKSFRPSPLSLKNVYIPKHRIVQVPSLTDKVVQNAICENYLYDVLTKPLTKETSACLKERGTLYATKLVKSQLRRYCRLYGKEFYALKCDIKSYFATIPHDKLISLADRYVDDEDIKEIMIYYIKLSGVGLALGLRQSQLLANLFLSPLDHYCKEALHAEFYDRHMDDFCIISNDYGYLAECLRKIQTYIENLGLKLNPKTRITRNKLDYLGFTFYIDDKGKAVQRLLNSKKATKKRHIRMMLKQVACGEKSVEDFAKSYQSWRVHALHGDCYKMVNEWDLKIEKFLNEFGYVCKFKKNKVEIYVKDN